VIHAARAGELPQVRGLLTELITTAPSHARAIEVALGPWAQAIVVKSSEDLPRGRRHLCGGRVGADPERSGSPHPRRSGFRHRRWLW
jgi:chromosome segregation ATPase